jgi:hypothetical protein
LPARAFSYLLQDWDQSLCVEQAYGQGSTTAVGEPSSARARRSSLEPGLPSRPGFTRGRAEVTPNPALHLTAAACSVYRAQRPLGRAAGNREPPRIG